MDPTRPIGIFDSGIGGLSVLRHIREQLPAEDLFYVSDSGHLPYGAKGSDFVAQRAQQITRFLIAQGAKTIVIACNTATAAAVASLRQQHTLPIIGMEPGLKPGIAASRNGVVGILATEGTLGSAKFRDLLRRHGEGARVIIRPCHGWVRQVESTDLSGPRALKVVAEEIQPLIDQGVDSLVLGCTHFPFLHQAIRQMVPAKTHIIDTGPAVAKELKRRLVEQGLLRRSTEGEVRCWCSGEIAQTKYQVERLWRPGCPVLPLPVE
ncbi:glutamate racemase [Candidatus Endoriftia persephone]|jgi:glutamate racemase|uniref:Glutamate racemase n=3 Tax=Gammaproteobacteria TaxID=1236 RepID=G2FIL2_9GAMM|nr:glutamate racemase [Candidatus Endoriftia persephone]EGV50001.1 glutamate racemase [endosymbiont of Riftia pachyptila (vent Ph05)]EGW53324.1 glutamate racemase [endosymbiont of Tevnia jerichonana (vent Tica)]USF86532.1 glutamate racemase [Candidatus Endoriftia persephone]